jgi:hypothetical protein
VTQLYPKALGTHFSRLLRHAWVIVGLFFNPGHHTGYDGLNGHVLNKELDKFNLKKALNEPHLLVIIYPCRSLTQSRQRLEVFPCCSVADTAGTMASLEIVLTSNYVPVIRY